VHAHVTVCGEDPTSVTKGIHGARWAPIHRRWVEHGLELVSVGVAGNARSLPAISRVILAFNAEARREDEERREVKVGGFIKPVIGSVVLEGHLHVVGGARLR